MILPESSKDEFFMREALKEAKTAFQKEEVPVGAVLVYDDKVISRAHNQVELLKDATAHAEMLCLSAVGSEVFSDWRLNGTTLYSTLEPCTMCAGAMIQSRIKRLVWGAPDLRIGANGSFVDLFAKKHPFHEIEITSGILADECAHIMQEFFQQRRK